MRQVQVVLVCIVYESGFLLASLLEVQKILKGCTSISVPVIDAHSFSARYLLSCTRRDKPERAGEFDTEITSLSSSKYQACTDYSYHLIFQVVNRYHSVARSIPKSLRPIKLRYWPLASAGLDKFLPNLSQKHPHAIFPLFPSS